ncbi:hypothetical protein [Parageobacillus galactosidasius]|uniref:Uncharacterized protein n=1 Tax=Parageobacillus galactosidasius TaxID=883812 RepID=A0A226QJ67_9BACL|nr:hypothetical protein [Parageobacillus galactosidasius]OXB92611.1 hypothetical protein B9L23_15680 [Parageobacillus galactosidasius]
MYKKNDEPGDILLRDWIAYIHDKLGQEQWITVYSSHRGDWGATYFFSALIPNSKIEESLNNESWDLHIGDGMPGFSVSYTNGVKQVKYHRFGDDDGIEPLILYRQFHGIKNDYVEVSEEFRLFHNLYHDTVNNKFIKIDDSGNEEDVILFEEDRVQIKLKYLKQFLAIKEMHLAIYFSIDRYSNKSLKDYGLMEEVRKTVKEGNIRYHIFIEESKYPIYDNKPLLSRIEGKKLIPGVPKEKSGIWPYNEQEKEEYEEFIIDTDENGEPVFYTCNPNELADYFGKNPGAPHYLTPVFFRRDVLTKYYSKPELYSVEDGYLRCGGLWGLRIDNNHEKYVVVYLGDLGRDLPPGERAYWKSFNVTPDGTISDVNWKRNFLGEFADPEKADLVFKLQFNVFQKKWQKKFGWPLFKPLSEDDEHNFKALRVPITNEQHEFDQQVLSLAKVLIDSLNEKQIEQHIPEELPNNTKGIAKLAKFLEAQGLMDFESYIKFLRSLWDLRIGAGHRKGDTYQRGAAYFKLEERPLAQAFAEILEQATTFLKYLDEKFLSTEKFPESYDD